MAFLQDFDAVRDWLKEAIDSARYWVLLTNSAKAHGKLAILAMSFGIIGLADDDMNCSAFDWLDIGRNGKGQVFTLFVLTLPKNKVTYQQLSVAFLGVGLQAFLSNDAIDLITIYDNQVDAEPLARFLVNARQGNLYSKTPGNN